MLNCRKTINKQKLTLSRTNLGESIKLEGARIIFCTQLNSSNKQIKQLNDRNKITKNLTVYNFSFVGYSELDRSLGMFQSPTR